MPSRKNAAELRSIEAGESLGRLRVAAPVLVFSHAGSAASIARSPKHAPKLPRPPRRRTKSDRVVAKCHTGEPIERFASRSASFLLRDAAPVCTLAPVFTLTPLRPDRTRCVPGE